MSLEESEIFIDLAYPPAEPRGYLSVSTADTVGTTTSYTSERFDTDRPGSEPSQRNSHVFHSFKRGILAVGQCILMGLLPVLGALFALLPIAILFVVTWYLTVTAVTSQLYFLLLFAQVFQLQLGSFMFQLYLCTQFSSIEATLTLSLTAQTLHLKPFRWLSSGIILPLDEVISFSGSGGPVIDTTGHVLAFYSASYVSFKHDTAHRLNRFLQRARQRNETPTPYTPLRDLAENRFRLAQSSPTAANLPSLSRLSLHDIDESSFKCINRREFPVLTALGILVMFFLWISCILISLLLGPDKSFSVFYKDPSVVVGNLAYVTFSFCLHRYRYMSSTWIFSTKRTDPFQLRHRLDKLFRVHHIHVVSRTKVEVEKYCGRSIHGFRRSFREDIPTCNLFKVHFLGIEGEEMCISGLTEGEILYLTGWLQQRFPFLFEQESDEYAESAADSDFELARSSLGEDM